MSLQTSQKIEFTYTLSVIPEINRLVDKVSFFLQQKEIQNKIKYSLNKTFIQLEFTVLSEKLPFHNYLETLMVTYDISLPIDNYLGNEVISKKIKEYINTISCETFYLSYENK
ncbi:hypothetical protein CDIK_4098, partial [Cucumispora dikerogammari]